MIADGQADWKMAIREACSTHPPGVSYGATPATGSDYVRWTGLAEDGDWSRHGDEFIAVSRAGLRSGVRSCILGGNSRGFGGQTARLPDQDDDLQRARARRVVWSGLHRRHAFLRSGGAAGGLVFAQRLENRTDGTPSPRAAAGARSRALASGYPRLPHLAYADRDRLKVTSPDQPGLPKARGVSFFALYARGQVLAACPKPL